MEPFAKWLMERPRNAWFVVVGASLLDQLMPLFFGWVAPSVVGLLILRNHNQQAVMMALWSVLPSFSKLTTLGVFDPNMVLSTMTVCVLATMLRITVNWSSVLMTSVLLSVLFGLLMQYSGLGWPEFVVNMMREALTGVLEAAEGLTPQATEQIQAVLGMIQHGWIAKMLGFTYVLMGFASLLIARYWQALLYYPGGFQKEMHQLRLPFVMAIGLLAAALALPYINAEWAVWAPALSLPLLVSGLALTHFYMKAKGFSQGFYVVFYLLWAVLPYISLALVALAAIDSFAHVRRFIESEPAE